jgi:6-phosphogluconolactonase
MFMTPRNLVLGLIALACLSACGAGSGKFGVGTAPGGTPGQGAITGKFVYVTNAANGNVSAFSVNPASGALALVSGSPFPTQVGNFAIAIDAPAGFAYVSSTANASVFAATVDAAGGLGGLAANPYFTGDSPVSIATDPAGHFVYTANNGSHNISGFSIGSSGALAAIPGSPFPGGLQPEFVAVHPNGDFLYVTNEGDNNVSVFSIGQNGALTPVPGSPFATGSSPRAIALDPNGQFLYIANFLSSNISAFSIETTSGTLTPVPGSPFASSGGASLAVEKSGRYLYVADGFFVDGFTLNSGVPTPMAANPIAAGFRASALAIDASGKFLYALDNQMSGVTGLSIDSTTGGLTLIVGSPFALILGSTAGVGATDIVAVN